MRFTAGLLTAAMLAGCGGDPPPRSIPRIDPSQVGPQGPGRASIDAAARGGPTAGSPGAVFGSGISDEQDFDAVASRETIESDAERIARQRDRYRLIAPTTLPSRDERAGPSIVEYALSTVHPPGRQVYRRFRLFRRSHVASCSKYGSSDLAQEAFLSLGGPQKDRENLDPDGDGYACGWDPGPFREVAGR